MRTDTHPFRRLFAGFALAVGIPIAIASVLYLLMVVMGGVVGTILAYAIIFGFVALLVFAMYACITADF